MIHFLVTRAHGYTIEQHLETWGRRLRASVRPIFYDQLVHYRRLPAGTYLFADLERLDAAQMELAGAVWRSLRESGLPVRLLNDPQRLLRREALLAELHARELNPFAACRADRIAAATLRFPVFVRHCDEHDGSLTPLLESAAELEAALRDLQQRKRVALDRLLVVEYCNTADASGIFRKYAAYIIGQRIVPRHLFHSRQWMVKSADIVNPQQQAEETAYLLGNPHERQLREIFALAQVDYGRVDYSLLADRPVVWEINTNPMLGLDPCKMSPLRLASQAEMFHQLNDAFLEVDTGAAAGVAPLRLPRGLRRRLGVGGRQRALRALGRAMQRLASLPPWKQALGAAR